MDEEQLKKVIKNAIDHIEKKNALKNTRDRYYDSLRIQVVKDLLTGEKAVDQAVLDEYDLSSSVYQVVTYEKFDPGDPEKGYSFAELLSVSGLGRESFVHLEIGGEDILFLIGEAAIRRFSDVLKKYDTTVPQHHSPLDTLFLAYGRKVSDAEAAVYSYQEAVSLMERRFFCDEGTHILGADDMISDGEAAALSDQEKEQLSRTLSDYVQSFNRGGIAHLLSDLKERLKSGDDDIADIRLMLTDVFLSAKERINHLYTTEDLPFDSNAEIIRYVESQFYLYEILRYITEQCEKVMTALGGFSGDSVLDAVINYINYNYASNITLENIAPLFGYNSSYLGKIFSKKMGETFNSYLDKVRITRAKKELLGENIKVYTVAERVGYKNVDYFHVKFKKYTGMSPAEYRRSEREKG